MLDVCTVGANFSARAYRGDENGQGRTRPPQLTLATHRFSAAGDGRLVHEVDDIVRAIVEPSGFDDYVEHWPDAGHVVTQLRAKARAAQQAAADQRASIEAEVREQLKAEIMASVRAEIAAAAKPAV